MLAVRYERAAGYRVAIQRPDPYLENAFEIRATGRVEDRPGPKYSAEVAASVRPDRYTVPSSDLGTRALWVEGEQEVRLLTIGQTSI
jgi:hypothetical protein